MDLSQKRIAHHFAVLPQHKSHEGEAEFTVYEIVNMGLYATQALFKYTKKQVQDKVYGILEEMGILHLKERKMNQISGGERQIVLLARAIIQNTPCLLLDEPTNHLDIYHQYTILDYIASIDINVIIIFHDLTMAAKYCDYIYLMAEGKIYTEGNPAEVLTTENINNVYKIKPTIISHPVSKKLVVLF
jgi:iron complex transport system ATP-binding protein